MGGMREQVESKIFNNEDRVRIRVNEKNNDRWGERHNTVCKGDRVMMRSVQEVRRGGEERKVVMRSEEWTHTVN